MTRGDICALVETLQTGANGLQGAGMVKTGVESVPEVPRQSQQSRNGYQRTRRRSARH